MGCFQVELKKVSEIIPYALNAKKHPDQQVEEIAASIREYGFNVPVLLDKQSVILAGMGRYLAAQKLGLYEVPVIYLRHLTPEQERKFRLADNKVAESKWDEVLLIKDLVSLKETGCSVLDIPGFTEAEIDKLLHGLQDQKGLVDPDSVPDMRKDHDVKPGDLFDLGGHRLLCGDSTLVSDTEVLLNGFECAMCFTDPPYNVDYQGGKSKKREKIKNDKMSADRFYEFLDAVYKCIALAISPGSAFYICHADTMWKAFREPLVKHDLILRQCLVWVKSQFVLSRADYHYRHEPILYGNKKGKHFWNGGRDKSSVLFHQNPAITVQENGTGKTLFINTSEASIIIEVSDFKITYQDEGLESAWFFAKPLTSDEHPTMKPVELVKRAVRNSSSKNDIVFDPFLGSGTTMIACEDLGRKCYGIELSPEYCDVIIRRWEEYTGAKAELVFSKERNGVAE